MKFVTSLLFICILLTSCKNATQTDLKPQSSDTDSLKRKFAPIFNGDWVAVSYMDSVKLSRSPFKSQDILPGIVELSIGIDGSISDSVIIGATNIHEGTSLTMYFRPGKLSTSLPLDLRDYENPSDYFELGYSVEENDTVLLLYHFNHAGNRISETKYSKVTNHREDAFQYQLNKALFSGIYERIDSLGVPGEVEFTNDGAITGLPNWNTYFVVADFVAATDSATDEICFEIQTKDQTCFAYRFDGDTLRLFKEIEDKNGEFQKLGDLEYELGRKGKTTPAIQKDIDNEVLKIQRNSHLKSVTFSIQALKKVLHYISYNYLSDDNGYVKISRQFSRSNDTTIQTFYLRKGSLIFATEKIISYYTENNKTDSITWGGDFYFSNNKLIDYITLGHGKSEDETWNPEQDILSAFSESKKDIDRHRKK